MHGGRWMECPLMGASGRWTMPQRYTLQASLALPLLACLQRIMQTAIRCEIMAFWESQLSTPI